MSNRWCPAPTFASRRTQGEAEGAAGNHAALLTQIRRIRRRRGLLIRIGRHEPGELEHRECHAEREAELCLACRAPQDNDRS